MSDLTWAIRALRRALLIAGAPPDQVHPDEAPAETVADLLAAARWITTNLEE